MNEPFGKLTLLLLIALCAVLFIPFIGNIHLFEWDEINFAECAREMLVSNNYNLVQIDFKPFWEKPPLFFWLQSTSMHFFGIGEFAARLPNALLGILNTIIIYLIGKKEVNAKFGFLWALLFIAMPLPHLYFKSGIIDPWFNFFIFLSVYFFYLSNKKIKYDLLAGTFLGLALITKGPVCLLIVGLVLIVNALIQKLKFSKLVVQCLYALLPALILSILWLWPAIKTSGLQGLNYFLNYQLELLSKNVAGHKEPFYYHFIVLLLGCFPVSIFIFNKNNFKQTGFGCYMLWLGIIPFIVFSLVTTKIVHYSSLCYIPISFLGAQFLSNKILFTRFQKILFSILALIITLLLFTAPFVFNYLLNHNHLIKDGFTKATLVKQIAWPYWLGLIALLPLFGYVLFYKKASNYLLYCLLNILFIQTALYAYAPRGEQIAQAKLIELIEKYSKMGKVNTYHYCYSKYFYGQTKETILKNASSEIEYLSKNNCKFFIVVRNKDEQDFMIYNKGHVQLIEMQDGYMVYEYLNKK